MNFNGYSEIRCGIYRLISSIYSTLPTLSFINLLNDSKIFDYLIIEVECFKDLSDDLETARDYLRNLPSNNPAISSSNSKNSKNFIGQARSPVPTNSTNSTNSRNSRAGARPAPTSNSKNVLENLRQDFMRLFVGPYKLLAPPWESVYRSNKKLVFQEPSLAVRNEYIQMGFVPVKIFVEPDDHISLELSFMALLCEKENKEKVEQASCLLNKKKAEDKKNLRMTELKFLKEHICQWVPAFCDDIISSAQTKFYSAIAQFTSKFLQFELEYLTVNGN